MTMNAQAAIAEINRDIDWHLLQIDALEHEKQTHQERIAHLQDIRALPQAAVNTVSHGND